MQGLNLQSQRVEERQRAVQTDLDKEKQPRKRSPAHTRTHDRRKRGTTHGTEKGGIKHSSRKWGTSGEVTARVLAAGGERSRGGPMHSGGSPWGQGPARGPGGCSHSGQPGTKGAAEPRQRGEAGKPAGREGRGAEGNHNCGRDRPHAAASWGSAPGRKPTPEAPQKPLLLSPHKLVAHGQRWP